MAGTLADPPLVLDFDGTITRADTLEWLRHRCAQASPAADRERARQREISKQAEKIYLWAQFAIDLDEIPWDDVVLQWARAQRDAGRRLVLATGSSAQLARDVAEHLDLFEEAWGSTPQRNLTGPRKAAGLVEVYGKAGFDYVGDSVADLPVWEASRQGYVVLRPTTPPFALDGLEVIRSPLPIVDPEGRDLATSYHTH